MTDSETVFYIDEHLEADKLRADTAKYLSVIRDYAQIIKNDKTESSFLASTASNMAHKIGKLEVKNERLKKVCVIEFGAFVFTASLALILWHYK